MPLQKFRELVNLQLYGSKDLVLRILHILSLFISIASIGALVYYWGFTQTPHSESTVFFIIRSTFGFYVLHYFIRVLYDFDPPAFFRQTWFELVVIILLIIEGISDLVFDRLLIVTFLQSLEIPKISSLTLFFTQIYLVIIVIVEVSQKADFIPKIKIHPSNIFILSFIIICLVGSGMLMLPEMTTLQGSMPFIDALFTSVSATCVTGLSVVNVADYFTFKGQFVIMALMKLGGLNIVSFAFSQALLIKFGVGMKQHEIIEDFIQTDSMFSSKGTLQRIFILSIIIEVIGTLLIFFSVQASYFKSFSERLFFSMFHSVSAFNNAGFSTLTDGMYNEYFREAWLFQVIALVLVFIGGLGFTVIFDLFSFKNIKDRLQHKWKKPYLSSRIAIYMSVALTIIGAIVFYLLERDNTLDGYSLGGSVVASFFQSISTRSAGLNTVDIAQITTPSIIAFLVLMFIGGSTYSTAGGIKTSTFAVIMLSVYTTIRGKKNIEIFKRTISPDDLLKAFSVFLFNIGGILTGIFLLSITESEILAMEGRTLIDLIFEEVSAFTTCGLSTGITSNLSAAGKYVIIFSMFVGRIGTLTVAFALSKNVISNNYKYPTEHIMVG